MLFLRDEKIYMSRSGKENHVMKFDVAETGPSERKNIFDATGFNKYGKEAAATEW
jgi:hypothetical protein